MLPIAGRREVGSGPLPSPAPDASSLPSSARTQRAPARKEGSWPSKLAWLIPAAVVAITLASFAPILGGEFLSLGDGDVIRFNPRLHALDLGWMWRTTMLGLYRPLAWMSWSLDYALWGLNPFGYHLTSVLLHVGTTALVYVLALQLLADVHPETPPGVRAVSASVAALAFGVHPLRVEPVAWIEARADLLAGLCSVAATLMYRAAAQPIPVRGAAGASLAILALGGLAKPSAVTLPLVWLGLELYPWRRWPQQRRRVLRVLLPAGLVGGVFAAIGMLAKAQTDTILPRATAVDPFAGIARAAYSTVFALRQTLFPGTIAPFYERPYRLDPWSLPFIASVAFVLVLSVVLIGLRRRWPAGLLAWWSFAVLYLPSSGLIAYGSQLVAARYTYLATIPLAILAGGAVVWIDAARRQGVLRPVVATAVSAGLGLALLGSALLTWRLCWVWRDTDTLWTYALLVTPDAAIPHLELAMQAERRGDFPLAQAHYAAAMARWPGARLRHESIAQQYEREGRLDLAARHRAAAR